MHTGLSELLAALDQGRVEPQPKPEGQTQYCCTTEPALPAPAGALLEPIVRAWFSDGEESHAMPVASDI